MNISNLTKTKYLLFKKQAKEVKELLNNYSFQYFLKAKTVPKSNCTEVLFVCVDYDLRNHNELKALRAELQNKYNFRTI